jgi:Acetyltransferase (GNAT) domain
LPDDLEIRAPTPADLPALGKLYEEVKGRPRPESVTRHRLFDTPWGDSIALIALDGEVCASMAVYWPVAMRVGDNVVPGAQGMEAVTHPDYRNRPRLFLTLARQGRDLALEKMDVLYTFPNVRSIKLTKHVGAVYLGEVAGWGVDLERRRLRLPRLWERRHEVAEPPRTDELGELASRAHAQQQDVVRIDKSAAWLSWRYSDATCENYEWVVARDDSGSLTAAALLGERDPTRWGSDFAGIFRIHELFALDEQAARSVLGQAVGRVRSIGARKLDVLVKDPMLEQAVRATGFQLEHQHPITTLHAAKPLGVDTYDFDRWRLISGDHDFF